MSVHPRYGPCCTHSSMLGYCCYLDNIVCERDFFFKQKYNKWTGELISGFKGNLWIVLISKILHRKNYHNL